MFYSQFILAKKGPLGTIWIAAHLERKLRKNQVADTDIGDSVDSILFPDAPIALRLSSHLLLGVVRIYSRKVNYLFDDCSEALLKIKQAFRSTAVDLPPEESTAPYHSITLPETFDLDDFELPDNEIFQGNYVDHHVSTREQITLQDTMDGVVYSTSQFGLDERFGDGDASQIGLDLEEDLFLDKNAALMDNGVLDADLQASVQPMASLEKEKSDEGIRETWQAMAVDGAGYQIQGIIANSDFIEYAQAPSTPGLVEVHNVSSVQETSVYDDHLEKEVTTLTDTSMITASPKSDIHHGDEIAMNDDLNHDAALCIFPKDKVHISNGLDIKHTEGRGDSPSTAMTIAASDSTVGALYGPDSVEKLHDGALANPDLRVPSFAGADKEGHLEDNQVSLKPGTEENLEESCSPSNALAAEGACASQTCGRPDFVNDEAQVCQELKDPRDPGTVVHEERPSIIALTLRPCTSHINQSDDGENTVVLPDVRPHPIETSTVDHVSGASAEVQGEVCHKNDVAASSEDVQADLRGLEGHLNNAISIDNQLENVTTSEVSELPAPEKVLSAPEGDSDQLNNLHLNSTPDKEALAGSNEDFGMELISGKKRSFTESTLTIQSLNSVESVELTRSKKTAESIPDDDDLLSSILVGRRSTAMKMKLTPREPDVTSMKRLRSAPRPSASKRKVVMDDPMVLHGDTIRQQLTSTEDMRRVRKKAPCTRPEISMIERQFLEDEIFCQPISGGMSGELNCLHSEKYNLSGITVSQTFENSSSSEAAKDIGVPSRPTVTEESVTQERVEPIVVCEDVEAQPAETLLQTMNNQGEGYHVVEHDTDVAQLTTAEQEPYGESTQMDIDKEYIEVADAANDSVLGTDVSYAVDIVSGDIIHNMPAGSVDENTSCLSPVNKLDPNVVEGEASILVASNLKDGTTDAAELDAGNHILVDSESRPVDELLSEETKDGPPIETKANFQTECSACDDQTASVTGESKLEVVNEDEGLSTELSCDEKNLASNPNHLQCDEELKIPQSIEFVADMPIALGNEEAQQQRTLELNAEIHSSDYPPLEDHGDIENVGVENNTDFLNVDDEEVAEEDDEYEPYSEETRLLENSGWSSRTRAVSKYLQTMFEQEALHGRKVLPMDKLLAGKTRKEASRMFFETLVLKTRDFIHVDQAKPFDNVDIKPRLKLMKTNF